MRILFWSYSFWPAVGGVEIFSAELLPALRERGCEFLVVTSPSHPDQPFEERYKGIPIFRFPFRDATSYTNIDRLGEIRQRIAQLIRSFSPDLVHMNYGVDLSNFFYLTTANALPTPFLVTMHGIWQRNSTLEERILRMADWVTCVSTATLEYGRKLVPEIIPRSSVIYNSLAALPTRSLSFSAGPPRLLCIGRLSHEKGFDVAISAFAALVERFSTARLIIAGEGPSKGDLERQAANLNIADVVEFVGWVAPGNVASLISSSTMVLMPSRTEGLPLVALEASFLARPLVVSRVGGLPEVVVHEETGLVVEPEDSNALAKAVEYLLFHPETAETMGQAARKRAQRVFSWEQHVNAYDTIYRRLVKVRRGQFPLSSEVRS